MNLAAYDTIMALDLKKTWIDPRFKRMYSYELPRSAYYTILKRYNNEHNVTEYFIALYDERQPVIKNYTVYRTDNVKKYYLYDIWEEAGFDKFDRVVNINLIVDDSQEDCIIYKFDI